MIKFKTISVNGDATTTEEAILDKKYTVQEFIDTVMSATRDFRVEFRIGMGFVSSNSCEYYNKRLKKSTMTETDLKKNLNRVVSNGGWGQTTYFLDV